MENVKTALITGVSRRDGIGFETARQLGLQGFTVVVSARQLNQAELLARELTTMGITASALSIDQTNDQSVKDAVEKFRQKFEQLDVLINNGALMLNGTSTIADKNLQELTEELDTNVTGPWRVTQQFLPLLKKSGHGRIVNVSSSMGSITEPGWGLIDFKMRAIPAYAITKLALNGLTIKMAKEFKDDSILVNAVCPGFTATRPGMAEMGARPISESIPGIIWVATLPDDGPTGQFFRDKAPVAW